MESKKELDEWDRFKEYLRIYLLKNNIPREKWHGKLHKLNSEEMIDFYLKLSQDYPIEKSLKTLLDDFRVNYKEESKDEISLLIDNLDPSNEKELSQDINKIIYNIREYDTLLISLIFKRIVKKIKEIDKDMPVDITILNAKLREIKKQDLADIQQGILPYDIKEKLAEQLIKEDNIFIIDGNHGILDGKFYFVAYLQDGFTNYPMIIFEDGSVEAIKYDYGKDYHYIEMNDKYYIFKNKCIKLNGLNYISKNGIRRIIEKEKVDKVKLYDDLKVLIREYVDDDIKPYEYDIDICHILHSYMINILGKTFYLLLYSDKPNTGKSTRQMIYSRLQYNGNYAGKTTPALAARKIHFSQASVNIDEFERQSKENKNIILGLFNTGAYKNGTYEFVNMNKNKLDEQITTLRTFCTKTVSSNHIYYDETLLSRSIIRRCHSNIRRVKNSFNPEQKDLDKMQRLTDDLHIFILNNWKEITQRIYDMETILQQNNEIIGRRKDIIAMIVGIYSMFHNEYDSFLNYLIDKDVLNRQIGLYSDETYYLYELLTRNFLENAHSEEEIPKEISLANNDIKEYVNKGLDLRPESKGYLSSKGIGKLIRDSDLLVDDKCIKRTGKGYTYTLNFFKFRELLLVSRYLNKIIENLKDESLELYPILASFGSFSSFGSSNVRITDELNAPNESNVAQITSNLSSGSPLDFMKQQEKLGIFSEDTHSKICQNCDIKTDFLNDQGLCEMCDGTQK